MSTGGLAKPEWSPCTDKMQSLPAALHGEHPQRQEADPHLHHLRYDEGWQWECLECLEIACHFCSLAEFLLITLYFAKNVGSYFEQIL